MTLYVGLDVASKLGMAMFSTKNPIAHVVQIVDDPCAQAKIIAGLIHSQEFDDGELLSGTLIGMELPVHFRNAVTARRLIERYGYIKYYLLENCFNVALEVRPTQARASIGMKSKEEVLQLFRPRVKWGTTTLKDDHSDALAVALFVAKEDGHWVNPATIDIDVWKRDAL